MDKISCVNVKIDFITQKIGHNMVMTDEIRWEEAP